MLVTKTSRLPTEIFYQIISFVRHRPDLLSILQVSRAFHAEAERLLYGNLDFLSNSAYLGFAGPALRAMAQTPRLYAHVHTLAVLYRHHFGDELVAALYQMRNLRDLNLQFAFVYNRQRVVWGAGAIPQSLLWAPGNELEDDEEGEGEGDSEDEGLGLSERVGTSLKMPFRLHSFRTDHWGNPDVAEFLLSQTELRRLDWQSSDMSSSMMNTLSTNSIRSASSANGSEGSLDAITTLSAANFPILQFFLQQRPGQIARVELLHASSAGFVDWWAGRLAGSFPEVRSFRMLCHWEEDLARLARLKERVPKLLFFETAGSERQPHEYSETLNCIADFPCLVKAKINLNLSDSRAERFALHLLKRRPTLEEVEIGSGRQWDVYRRKPEVVRASVSGTKYVGEIEGFRVERREGQKDAEEWLRW